MAVMCGKEACGLQRKGAAIKSRSIFPSSSSSLRAVPFSTVSRSGPRPSFSVSPWGATAAQERPKKKSLWERRVGSSFQFPTEEEGGRWASLAAHTIEQTTRRHKSLERRNGQGIKQNHEHVGLPQYFESFLLKAASEKCQSFKGLLQRACFFLQPSFFS